VLTLHGVILSFTTESAPGADSAPVTTISEPGTLAAAFWILLALSAVLYLVPRFRQRDRLEVFRAAIPPLALVVDNAAACDSVRRGLSGPG
jgi:hypothetical protein